MTASPDRLTMPGPSSKAADDIERVGVEGRPADPKAGPGLLWWELVLAFLVVFALIGVLGWFLGWAAAGVAFAFATIAFVLDPEVTATVFRARDRRKVARDHDEQSAARPEAPLPK